MRGPPRYKIRVATGVLEDDSCALLRPVQIDEAAAPGM
jgi:hypothetical protein